MQHILSGLVGVDLRERGKGAQGKHVKEAWWAHFTTLTNHVSLQAESVLSIGTGKQDLSDGGMNKP